MAPDSPVTIADVERLLEEKRSQLERLVATRERIQQQLNELDEQIQIAASPERPQRSPRRVRRRFTNTAPLRSFVIDILKKHKKGLTATEITAKVVEAGYRSRSKQFQNVVYQCLYYTPAITQDPKTGRYQIEKSE